ncbi:MAG: hypothetical protein ABJA67_03945 [Chthonomonadales bacterium]
MILAQLITALSALSLVQTGAPHVTTIAGTGVKGFSGDGGPANLAQLNNVYAIARGPDKSLYLCDVDNNRIRRIRPDGIIETVVGNGVAGRSGDGGPALKASLNQPYDIAWDRKGNLYFVEIGNHLVRRVDAKTGIITNVSGNGKSGFDGDGGPAKLAILSQPHSLAFDRHGDLFICDIGNNRIRKIEMKTGIISTWAGNGGFSAAPDGSPISGSALNGPRALVFDEDGNGLLALRGGNTVLKLDVASGTMKRVAGTGEAGFTGNSGPALEATLSGPKGISLDSAGNIYLADTESHSIRMINMKTGRIDVLIGNGKKGDGPDGDDPINCQLNRPHGIFVDRDGTIFVGDSENNRIRVYKR